MGLAAAVRASAVRSCSGWRHEREPTEVVRFAPARVERAVVDGDFGRQFPLAGRRKATGRGRWLSGLESAGAVSGRR